MIYAYKTQDIASCKTLMFYKNSRVVKCILPVNASICRYLQVNTTAMANILICQHFANLAYGILQSWLSFEREKEEKCSVLRWWLRHDLPGSSEHPD